MPVTSTSQIYHNNSILIPGCTGDNLSGCAHALPMFATCTRTHSSLKSICTTYLPPSLKWICKHSTELQHATLPTSVSQLFSLSLWLRLRAASSDSLGLFTDIAKAGWSFWWFISCSGSDTILSICPVCHWMTVGLGLKKSRWTCKYCQITDVTILRCITPFFTSSPALLPWVNNHVILLYLAPYLCYCKQLACLMS